MAQTSIFRGTARAILHDGGRVLYIYRHTAVVTVEPGAVVLDSGGWRTATTKAAMNQASNQAGLGFTVSQRAGEWFVNYRGAVLPFVDGMRLPA